MQDRHGRCKALLETRHELWGQRDLRYEHEALKIVAQARGDGVEIYLGLAAPGHAEKQKSRESAGVVE